MGTHHTRVISENPGAKVEVVIDTDPLRGELLATSAGARMSSNPADALHCDAAVVATTAESHFDVAMPLIRAGLPLLVEKPLTTTVDECEEMVWASESAGSPLMCGFVERFNPVVVTAEHLMDDYGRAEHLVALRHSPRDPLVAVSVVHDLLIHDVDLALRLCAGGWAGGVGGGFWQPDDLAAPEAADCTITFDGGAIATLSASRISQRKVRELRLATPEALMELDLIRRTITVYRHVRHQATPDGSAYRAETVIDIPFVRESGEPLGLQWAHFLALVDGRVDARAERAGLVAPHAVVSRLEAGALGALGVVH
jgi:predicted dehydrogenase